MAKKKANTSTDQSTASADATSSGGQAVPKKSPKKPLAKSGRARKSVPKETSTKKSATAKTATSRAPDQKPALSDEVIGHAAGKVWGTLADEGEQSLAAVKKSIDAPNDVVLAAVGWLAREGKIHFAGSGRSVKLSLR